MSDLKSHFSVLKLCKITYLIKCDTVLLGHACLLYLKNDAVGIGLLTESDKVAHRIAPFQITSDLHGYFSCCRPFKMQLFYSYAALDTDAADMRSVSSS